MLQPYIEALWLYIVALKSKGIAEKVEKAFFG
jgi:hypothetical protein